MGMTIEDFAHLPRLQVDYIRYFAAHAGTFARIHGDVGQ